MDKYLVNGLIVQYLLISASNVLQIQGYYSSTIVMHNNESDVEDLINLNYNINKNNRIDKTDEVFRHYRSDIKREPRFISFETRDDNIEVELDFAIPFLSIPVKRSLSAGGVANTVQSMLTGVPFANVNLGAVILAGFVAIGGAILGGLTRAFKNNGTGPVYTDLFLQKSDKSKQQRYYSDIAIDILENVDKALMKYNFDTTACTQRVVCWYIKESIANVVERKASQMDKIVEGMISADWALQLISGTAIEDAIRTGKQGRNCEQTFPNCKLNSNNMDKFIQNLLRNTETSASANKK